MLHLSKENAIVELFTKGECSSRSSFLGKISSATKREMNYSEQQHFDSDYMEGAHPKILERLLATNLEKTPGYGTDEYCNSAKAKIAKACECEDAEIHFLIGGTQTNATVIDGILNNYEGVLAAETGHIAIHEAGAIEASGHKVLTLPHKEGKIDAKTVEDYLRRFYADGTYPHMVCPGMVYISHPTEYGTIYSAKELADLHTVCKQYDIPLFVDGARLGYGLMATGTDVTLPYLAKHCDVFYIGGTKVGAMFGEAVVCTKPGLLKHFFTVIKQHGALMAKGRLLGIQFDTLFTDDLYFEISRHAICFAEKLKKALIQKGYSLFLDSPTNQQFVILENEKMKELSEKVTFSVWEPVDEHHTAVRFATSWATKEEDIDALIALL